LMPLQPAPASGNATSSANRSNFQFNLTCPV